MANFDWVLQPPHTAKYTFLVDALSEQATYGHTADMEKINYNRKLMGVNFNMEVGMNTALSQTGISAVLPLGRYVTIFQLSRNEQSGSMTFIDYQISLSVEELRTLLASAFPANLVDACLELQGLLAADFSPSDDIVQLEQV